MLILRLWFTLVLFSYISLINALGANFKMRPMLSIKRILRAKEEPVTRYQRPLQPGVAARQWPVEQQKHRSLIEDREYRGETLDFENGMNINHEHFAEAAGTYYNPKPLPKLRPSRSPDLPYARLETSNIPRFSDSSLNQEHYNSDYRYPSPRPAPFSVPPYGVPSYSNRAAYLRQIDPEDRAKTSSTAAPPRVGPDSPTTPTTATDTSKMDNTTTTENTTPQILDRCNNLAKCELPKFDS